MKSFPIGGSAASSSGRAVQRFQHVNYGNPNAVFGTANFGRIRSAAGYASDQLGGKIFLTIIVRVGLPGSGSGSGVRSSNLNRDQT